MNLAELQQLLASQLRQVDAPISPELDAQLLDDRMQVYRGNVLGAQIRALESVFPVIQRILGNRCFGRMLRDYALQHPFSGRDLENIGQPFPQWLRAEIAANPVLQDYAYLAEMARLELAHQQALVAADTQAFDFAGFQRAVAKHGAEQLLLTPAPSLSLLLCEWPVDRLWQAQQQADPPPVQNEPGPVQLAVLRQQRQTAHLRIEASLWRLLQALIERQPLAQIAAAEGAGRLPQLIASGLIGGYALA